MLRFARTAGQVCDAVTTGSRYSLRLQGNIVQFEGSVLIFCSKSGTDGKGNRNYTVRSILNNIIVRACDRCVLCRRYKKKTSYSETPSINSRVFITQGMLILSRFANLKELVQSQLQLLNYYLINRTIIHQYVTMIDKHAHISESALATVPYCSQMAYSRVCFARLKYVLIQKSLIRRMLRCLYPIIPTILIPSFSVQLLSVYCYLEIKLHLMLGHYSHHEHYDPAVSDSFSAKKFHFNIICNVFYDYQCPKVSILWLTDLTNTLQLNNKMYQIQDVLIKVIQLRNSLPVNIVNRNRKLIKKYEIRFI
ncbi:hypothetical protein AGLY_004734 [Aphis glycines]|uniref:Uncharacterized protein n=1 Tax=Aphis glycines TaxID=307491 RepID=A0A6G0TUT1_APHGL|nr:hypothetical protein AGLY_004734 [Aphis glycines]